MRYFVCQISARLMLGTMTEHASEEAAIEQLVTIVEDNGVTVTPEIRAQINNDLGFVEDNCEWSVQIGITG